MHSVNYGRVVRAVRGDSSVAEFARKHGLSIASVQRAEAGWLPNFCCRGNVAEKLGIPGFRWDWADAKAKHQGQVRIGL
jgi:hypothetical protein